MRGLPWPPRGLALLTFSCLGPCMAFHGRRVALLRLLCFLSWPLRGIPWPPHGLASPTLLPVAWPCFAYFASCHAWPSVTAVWPYFAHFLLCFLSWPLRGLPWPPRGLASPTLRQAPAWHSVAPAWYFLSWPLRGLPWPPPGLASPTLLFVMAPAWPGFTHFASCHDPCVVFRGPRVALLHLLCCLSWPLRGLASPTLLRVMTPAWYSVAPAWPCFTYFASCHDRCVAFCGPRVALLRLLCFLSCVALLCSLFPVLALAWPSMAAAWPCFAYFASCHGPCVAFRGPRLALLHLLCCLSWPLRGLASPTLLRVMTPAWYSVAPAWPCFTYFASCHDRCVAFCGPRVALLRLLCFLSCVALLCSLFPVLALAWPSMAAAWPCFTYFASCRVALL